MTPEDRTGHSIAKETVAVVRERGIDLKVLGMDGTRVNTGVSNGLFCLDELELGFLVQHIVCLLHSSELPLHHLFCNIDGITSGPDFFKGRIGKEVSGEVWKEDIVSYPTVKGKLPLISEERLKETSWY